MYKTRTTVTGNGMRGMHGELENVAKHSGKFRYTFRGMYSNLLGNVLKHSGECPQTFRGRSWNILGNVVKHFGEYPQTIQIIFENNLGHVVKHPKECMKAFEWMYIKVLHTSDHEVGLFAEEPLLLNSTSKQLD